MKKHYLKKGITAGVICLFILLSIPMVSGKEIIYPREEGPYNIIIKGGCTGIGGRYTALFNPTPLRFRLYFGGIYYYFEENSEFYVNGEKQDIIFPADVDITSFKGLSVTLYKMNLKCFLSAIMFFFTGSQYYIPSRVIGRCAEIRVVDAS